MCCPYIHSPLSYWAVLGYRLMTKTYRQTWFNEWRTREYMHIHCLIWGFSIFNSTQLLQLFLRLILFVDYNISPVELIEDKIHSPLFLQKHIQQFSWSKYEVQTNAVGTVFVQHLPQKISLLMCRGTVKQRRNLVIKEKPLEDTHLICLPEWVQEPHIYFKVYLNIAGPGANMLKKW